MKKTIILLGLLIILGFNVIASIDRKQIKETIAESLSDLFKEEVKSNDITIISNKSTKANIISNHTMIDLKYNSMTVSLIQSKNAK